MFDFNTDTWKIFDDYFKYKFRLTQDQLTSYEDLIENIIPSIIENNNPIKIYDINDNNKDDVRESYIVEIMNPRYEFPMKVDNNNTKTLLFPFEARTRNLSYMIQLIVDIKHTYGSENKQTQIIEGVNMCKIPCMINSKFCNLKTLHNEDLIKMNECIFDLGGYFIINGGEKVIVSQERVAENRVFVWQVKGSNNSKYSHICEIKASIDQRYNPIEAFSILLSKPTTKNNNNMRKMLICRVSGFNIEIPLFVLMRALGITTDEEIFKLCLGNHIDNKPMIKLLKMSVIHHVDDKKKGKKQDQDDKKKDDKKKHDDELFSIITQDDALNYLSKHLTNSYNAPDFVMKLVHDTLTRKLLPQCGVSYKKKAMFVGYMVNRLMLSLFNIRPFDDRDHYSNKRVDTSGALLAKIFRTYYINHIKEIKKTISSSNKGLNVGYANLSRLISSSSIESRLKYVLSTGNWGTNKNRDVSSDKGVAQVLNRLGYYSTISHTRRVHSPLDKAGNKIIKPRKLHQTHFGMCCPNETPEGDQVGIVKNLALQCKISINRSDYPIRLLLDKLTNIGLFINSDIIDINDISKCAKIILNGDIYGYVDFLNMNKLYSILMIMKRHNNIHHETSISWYIEWNEIYIQTDGGRYMRPLHIIDNDNNLMINKYYEKYVKDGFKWENLIVIPKHYKNTGEKQNLYNGACIEYIDTNQTENSLIAMFPSNITESITNKMEKKIYKRYTHCEIHPVAMLGIVAQMIPYSDCNQSPRNIYQFSMGRQAIGTYCTNYNYRFDTMGNILIYGERPFNLTKTSIYTNLDKLPHGANAMLLIGLAEGFNKEDPTVFNEDSIERGFFNTLYFKSYLETETQHKSTSNEIFMNPVNMSNILDKKIANYSILNVDGTPILNSEAKDMYAIIGKIVNSKDKFSDITTFRDTSVIVRKHEEGFIDAVIPTKDDKRFNSIINQDNDGNKYIAVRLCKLRKPEIGDKFASRHSQKGVISKVEKSINMPRNERGETADIIMNPHGFPSRMAEGQIVEMIGGKCCVINGVVQDATPFTLHDPAERYEKIIEKYGLDPCGNEIMYNGKTGKMYEINFFYCPTYYQRLKHMVIDKMHSRDTGPVQIVNRQPVEGRARGGGHRLGEMERDALISHGVSATLKESFVEKSDKFSRFVDNENHRLIIGNEHENLYKTNLNDYVMKDNVSKVNIPYSTNLIMNEINGLGIDIKLNVTF